MRCIDCKENEATIVWVQGTGVYANVRRAGVPDEESAVEIEASPLPRSETPPPGPNLCESCAHRRYDAHRGAHGPSWDEFWDAG